MSQQVNQSIICLSELKNLFHFWKKHPQTIMLPSLLYCGYLISERKEITKSYQINKNFNSFNDLFPSGALQRMDIVV